MAARRAALDGAGAQLQTLLSAADASFCNRTVLGGLPARTQLISRTRKDARLCRPAVDEGRRIYSAHKFTPAQGAPGPGPALAHHQDLLRRQAPLRALLKKSPACCGRAAPAPGPCACS